MTRVARFARILDSTGVHYPSPWPSCSPARLLAMAQTPAAPEATSAPVTTTAAAAGTTDRSDPAETATPAASAAE